MKGGRTSVKELLDELGNSSTSSPVLGESIDLFLSRDFTGDEEPEKTLRKGF